MPAIDSRISLDKLLAGAQLPGLPQSAIRLLELSQNPDNGAYQFAVPIESDPGLTSQVLRFVNSSYFGFRQEICSVKQAISLVGIRTIKNFSLWSAVFSLMPNPQCGPFDLRCLWQDSLRRGIFARRFGKSLGLPDFEDLFAGSLLQDMAVPILAKELPTEYHTLLDARQGGHCRLSDLERDLFGWTHADAGALIARMWHLPESFASIISKHADCHDLSELPSTGAMGIHVVCLSALLPVACDLEWPERERFVNAFELMAASTGESVHHLFELVDREFVEFAPVLNLALPSRTLSDFLQVEVAAVDA
jgi:HD-like signal output (HDOD) protein